MDWFVAFVEQAGFWGVVLASIGIPTLMLAFGAAFSGFALRTQPRITLTASALAGGCVVLLLLIGLIGMVAGYGQMAEMLSYLDGEEAAAIEAYGPRVASAPMRVALTFAGCAAFFAIPAWFRGSYAHKKSIEEPDGFRIAKGWAARPIDEI